MKIRTHIAFMMLISGSLLFSEGCKLLKKDKTKPDAFGNINQVNFDDYFIDACTHFINGNYTLSIKNLDKCMSLKPEEASVYFQLSKNYSQLLNPNLCLQNAMKAYNLANENPYYALWYSEKLSENGNLNEAIKILDKSFSKEAKDEQLLKALDALYIKNNNPIQDRINLWLKYKTAAGYKLKTALKLIEFYNKIQDYRSAHSLYDEIKKASPLKYQYFIEDANLYLLEKDEIHAFENFEKAIALNPNNFNLNYSMFKLKATKKQIQEANTFLSNALSDPLIGLDAKLDVCTQINQKIKEDTSYFQYTMCLANHLIKNYPDNPKSLFIAAGYLEKNKQFNDALNAYLKINDLSPGMYDAWLGAMNMAFMLNQFRQTILIADKALEFYPNVAQIYLEASKSLNSLKEYKKAIEYAKNGLSFAFDPHIKSLLYSQEGIAYFGDNNFKEAEYLLIEALKLNEFDGQVYEYLGNTYSKLNLTEKAVENWKKAKALGIQSKTLENKIKDGKYIES